jgi:uncharacterized protein (DUF433 family)
MATTETRYEHIVLNDDQTPIIAGTTMKVIELALETYAYGWSAEELHFQHPYLSLGQIYSALAYFFDHQAELEQEIQRRLANAEALRHRQTSPFQARLQAQRKT